MDLKYEFSGKIRYSETDENGQLSLNALVNYFQDVSTFQSEALGIGLDYLKEHHVAWILSSWQIEVTRYPKLCERVTAQTWPYEFKSFYGMRNFTLLSEQGELLAKANSIWVLYDLENGRPVRIFPEMIEKYQFGERLEMEYASRKIALTETGQEQESFFITKNHLDTNHHVNNGQYIVMAAEYLPEDFVIGQMRAEYRQQAHLHDEIFPVLHLSSGCRLSAERKASCETADAGRIASMERGKCVIQKEDTRKVDSRKVTVELSNAQGKAFAVVEFLEKMENQW